MHKDMQTLEKKTNLFTVALIFSAWTLLHHLVQHNFLFRSRANKSVHNVKERQVKINASNVRSHNKVIQVRCVELKLKVNNSNNKNDSKHQQQRQQGDERDAAQGRDNTEKERVD